MLLVDLKEALVLLAACDVVVCDVAAFEAVQP